MKKYIAVLLILIVCLAGCGKKDSDSSEEQSSQLKYSIDGVDLVPGTDFSEALEALGEPDKYSEAASCYFDGLDKSYTYSGFEVRTYPAEGDKDFIQDICITTDKYQTSQGITVGSSLDDVISKYGEDYDNIGSMYKYASGEGYTYFFIMDDAVKYFGFAVDVSN